MRKSAIIAILVFSAISIAGAQNSGSANANSQSSANHATTRRVVHIVSPASGENLEGTSVSIRYQVSPTKRPSTQPAMFRIQMDSQPPVETNETAYTFDSLTPGSHDVIVELLDSRNRPITSSLAKASFVCQSPETNSAELVVEPMLPPTLQKVAMFLPQAAAPIDPGDGSGEMPLLSVIGLGVLIGGMVSAMKTRV
jgi:hypothetical protein